ncbi:MAG TPA: hypothetical protein VKI65_15730 [Gemmataceae bacterium]|nr:hypothetical protein [Gemmataceae bacterium]
MRELLKDPAAAPVLAATGDLALAAQRKFIARYARDQHAYREAIQIKLEQLRAELTGPEPSPLEKLLVERVLICWLQVHIADCTFAAPPTPRSTRENSTSAIRAAPRSVTWPRFRLTLSNRLIFGRQRVDQAVD